VSIGADGVIRATPSTPARQVHPPGGYPINWWKVAFFAALGGAALWYVTQETPAPTLPTGAIGADGDDASDDEDRDGEQD
jgi:hypothetical protein